ncbi:MAG: GNAT family N-acetyltransferase [Clostridia bacterium]|nr:GNAT family N-acetyltransferase [Clostridia bacterium]
MQIKQAVIQTEKDKIKDFLAEYQLKFRQDVDYSFYAETDGKIVGTISLDGNLILQLAVDKNLRGENLALKLVDYAIGVLRQNKIYGYKVFTKPEYKDLFVSLGLKVLVCSTDFVSLEGGESDIYGTIQGLKTKITMEFGAIYPNSGAIVLNGNPITKGHLSLVEHALKFHEKVLIFVLEEDLSYFSFKERYSLAYLATRCFGDRVCVLPSTGYIVSKSTFPDYFLHGEDQTTKAFAEYDALIFREYFMKELGIKKRYFGSEKTGYMQIYNDQMKRVLGDSAEFVQRFSINDNEISAKTVRAYIESGETQKALALVPQSTRAVLNLILKGKNV